MSNISDSDDSDDDFLLQQRIFPKATPPVKKKKKLTSMKTLQQIVSGSPSNDECSTDKSKGRKRTQIRPKQPSIKRRQELKKTNSDSTKSKTEAHKLNIDPQKIEEQANKIVEKALRMDVVNRVANFNDIGWYRCKAKKSKNFEYYPAIISQNKAEARLLLKNKTNKNYETQNIQYIGVSWRYALTHQEIALSKWVPYSNGSDSENEERLQNFVKNISKTSVFKNDPLGLKVEESAIRKMWEKVKTQKEKRQREEERDREESRQFAATMDASAAASVPPVNVTQDSDSNCKHAVDSDDDDNDDSDDDENLASPGRKRTKRTALHLNDEIEYFEPIAIFGDNRFLRRATVVGIRPEDSSFPLILSNTTMPLPGTHCVRQLPDGFWQPICDFILQKEGIQSLADASSGFSEAANRMKSAQAEISKAADDFWKNQCGSSETVDTKTRTDEHRDENDCPGTNQKAKDSIANNGDLPVRRSRRSSLRSRRNAK